MLFYWGVAQLQAGIDVLASRAGRADLKTCAANSEHLRVRVDTGMGRYVEAQDYFVVRGY